MKYNDSIEDYFGFNSEFLAYIFISPIFIFFTYILIVASYVSIKESIIKKLEKFVNQ